MTQYSVAHQFLMISSYLLQKNMIWGGGADETVRTNRFPSTRMCKNEKIFVK